MTGQPLYSDEHFVLALTVVRHFIDSPPIRFRPITLGDRVEHLRRTVDRHRALERHADGFDGDLCDAIEMLLPEVPLGFDDQPFVTQEQAGAMAREITRRLIEDASV